jgi:hypothetical protein
MEGHMSVLNERNRRSPSRAAPIVSRLRVSCSGSDYFVGTVLMVFTICATIW